MTSQHTPGPWHVVEREFGRCIFPTDEHNPAHWSERGMTIGCVGIIKGMGEADEANARLVATAPELLEALQNIKANLTGKDCLAERVADSLRRAREAIAKVERAENEG